MKSMDRSSSIAHPLAQIGLSRTDQPLSHMASLAQICEINRLLAETDHMSKWERLCAREADSEPHWPLSHLGLSHRSVLSNQ